MQAINISTRSLFHYTRTIEVVKLILRDGLKFSHMEEEIPLSGYASCVFDQISGLIRNFQQLDGVCFCDIPLSQAKFHRQQYGEYAIGLSKEWGMKSGASPVRYVHSKSPDIGSEFFNLLLDLPRQIEVSGDIYGLMSNFMTLERINKEQLPESSQQILTRVNELVSELLEFTYRSASFMRIYEGEWEDRNTGTTCVRKFYDEREWRIVKPDSSTENAKFLSDDIRHILVETEEERQSIIDWAMTDCDILAIAKQDDFSRKVRLFNEFYDEA